MKIKCPFSNLNGCKRVFDEYGYDMILHLRSNHGETWTYVTGRYVKKLREIHEKIEEYTYDTEIGRVCKKELKSLLEDKSK